MNKINWYWACEFINSTGSSVWRILAASTPLGAKKRAFEVGRNFELTPKYDTIRPATAAEIRELKKKIKDNIKDNG